MRILHVTDRLSARGGADWHLLNVLRELSRDHELLVAVGRDDGSARAPCRVELVSGLEEPRCGHGNASQPTASSHPERPSVHAALDRLAGSFRPDIVHIHNAIGPEPLEWAAGRGAVMTVQDHRCFCPGRGKLTMAGVPCRTPMREDTCAGCFEDPVYFRTVFELTVRRRAAVGRMRALTVLSAYMKQELLAAAELSPERVAVIRPLVTGLDPTAQPEGPPCVLFAGRLARAKGVWDAARAWERSATRLPLAFAGSGAERAELERCGFEVLGWVPHERMSAVYRRAHAVLLPSRWQEPFGIVGPEALRLGVPVIAWHSGGVSEWHPGVSGGALVEWGNVDALAQALAAHGVARRTPERLEARIDFDPRQLMGQLLELYRAVAAA